LRRSRRKTGRRSSTSFARKWAAPRFSLVKSWKSRCARRYIWWSVRRNIRSDEGLMARTHLGCGCSRREFLVRGMYGLGVGAGLPLILSRTSAALAAQALQGTSVEKHPERILVVVELSGGNDGLNTVVPFGDPAYHRARPNLGIPDREVIKIADGFGFHPSMVGFERLYKDGLL